ncbi:hypothetical protein DUK53_05655 [Listeria sp. SHR_NRA_18]|nr:hypothetical protein EP56_03520 [Listeriaceae bacterium FSL A5-0209]RQW67799.1 hypothetical protein DUK53_05655 [Listeria sp. SHR_NRA_18]
MERNFKKRTSHIAVEPLTSSKWDTLAFSNTRRRTASDDLPPSIVPQAISSFLAKVAKFATTSWKNQQ